MKIASFSKQGISDLSVFLNTDYMYNKNKIYTVITNLPKAYLIIKLTHISMKQTSIKSNKQNAELEFINFIQFTFVYMYIIMVLYCFSLCVFLSFVFM